MIIITGGAGFIGSNLVSNLSAKYPQEKLIVCDNFDSTSKWKNLVRQNIYDLIYPEQLFLFLEKQQNKRQIKAIFHLGAITNLNEMNVDVLAQNNIRLSIDLFEWCGRNRIRFIYTTTAATYGNGEHGFVDEDHPEYLNKLRPLTPYAWSKHILDKVISNRRYQSYKEDPLPPQCIGLKLFNVYGPNEYHKDGQVSIISQFYYQIKEKGFVKLFKSEHPHYADGSQSRDWIYVEDCINVMVWLYENPQINGLLNVGSGVSVSYLELAHYLFKHLDKKEEIHFIDMPATMREGYQYMTQADLRKLSHEGYTLPFTLYEEAINKYVHDYLEKDNPYK